MQTTTYNPSFCEVVSDMSAQGALPSDLAKVLNIDLATLEEWRKLYPEFNEALERGLEDSEAWWMSELKTNLDNPDFDRARAMDVLVKYFGWKAKP